MIPKSAFLLSLLVASSIVYAQVPKVDVNLLNGDQPKLLTGLARSLTTKEALNGSGKDITSIIGGWHAQAVGQYKDYIYVAFSTGDRTGGKIPTAKSSNYAAQLWIYNTKTGESKMIELEKGYAHPCSIQITGKYLMVAIEAEYGLSQAALGTKRETKSMALIFDLEQDPNGSVEVARIAQDNVNSGGAGLTYHPQAKCWFLLMDQDEAGKVALYKTKDQNITNWIKEPIAKYKRFGSGAGLNLITASDNSIWGIFYDVTDKLPGLERWEISGDEMYLFKLVEPTGDAVAQRTVFTQVVNVQAPRVKQAGELLANRPGMRFGASLRNENGKLELLMCQRNMDEKFYISRTPVTLSEKTQVVFVNFARTKAEIKCSSLTNRSQSYSSQPLQMESWSGILDAPVSCSLKYLPISTSSLRSFNMPKWTEVANYESKAPLTLVYMEGTDNISAGIMEFVPKTRKDKKLD